MPKIQHGSYSGEEPGVGRLVGYKMVVCRIIVVIPLFI